MERGKKRPTAHENLQYLYDEVLCRLQLDSLQILRNKEVSVEVFLSFFCVKFFAAGDVLVLGMVEDQVLYTELLCQFTGIFSCGVMFLIWESSG